MKRIALGLLLLPALAFGQAQGPYGIFGGPIQSAKLAPAAQVPTNTYAFTTDQGLMVDNGSSWVTVSGGGGSGTVTTLSVVTANGLKGTVANPTTTPAITLAPNFTGISYSNGTGFAAATSTNVLSLWMGTCSSSTYLNGAGVCTTPSGSGTVTDGAGTTTAGQVLLSTTTAHTYTVTGTPALPNGTTATTQTTADNSTKIATDAFVLANSASAGVTSVAAGAGISVTGTGSGPYTGAVTVASAYSIRVVSGTTDTILSTDCANGVEYTSSSAVAVTLPQATSSFAACSVDVIAGGTGTVTVTPTTSTINGGSSLSVTGSKSANITAVGGNYVAAGSAVGSLTQTIASGTAALGTSAIASGACASAVTVSASGVATTDTINASFNGDPTGIVGYEPSTSGMLTIIAYPTAGDVNFKTCNNTGSSITPGAVTLNWAVRR